MSSHEVWFRRSAIRGFGIEHWKGPLFVAALSCVGIIAGLFALANAEQPVLAVAGVLVAAATLLVGFYVCHLHTAED
jgi:hypothetical protein